jgi:3-hydroxybutyryl-CoA dehydrogenase
LVSSIKTIGIIGAGTMGSGIASVSAMKGFKTILYDVNKQALTKTHAMIAGGYDKLIEKEKIDAKLRKKAEASLYYISDMEEIAECDLIIEAAVENIDLKKVIYAQLNDIVPDDAILATNTSSFSITAISSAVKKNRGRVIGMHFFNPANIMKLVEIIKGEFTSEETVNTVAAVTRALGKVPVVCKDTPAFIVNRVARSFYGEALKIFSESNLDVKDIDIIMKEEGGFVMGPFELMDLIGIDVNLSVTKSVYEAFFYDSKYKPSPIQQKMVEAGMLGKKTKRGFYNYE